MGSANYFYDDGGKVAAPFSHGIPVYEPFSGEADKAGDHTLLNERNAGIFCGIRGTRMGQVTDGTSNAIMIGEMQRVWYETNPLVQVGLLTPGAGTSYDGWAVAGVGNLFATEERATGGINTGQYESPGSEHAGGAFFGMADASVTFLSEDIDLDLFSNLGSRASGRFAAQPDPEY